MVLPNEVRPGISNWKGYLNARDILQDLVSSLENPENEGWEMDNQSE